MSQSVERLFGVLAAGLGVVGALYALFGPSYVYGRYENGAYTSGWESLWQHGFSPVTLLYLILMAALFLSVALLAVRDARWSSGRTLLALIAVALLLVGGSILGFAASGMVLAPGALVALVTAIGAALRRALSAGLPRSPSSHRA